MKNLLLFCLIINLSFNCYSQISFEKGYYVNNENKKFDCLIENEDWKNNPTEIKYKESEGTDEKNLEINSIKEFGIYNISKYIRYNVNIDRSSNNISYLSKKRKPTFIKEQLFLKVLVEGKADLYLYEVGNLKRFFYGVDDNSVAQLVYKRYKISEKEIATNDEFRQQLWNELKCSNISISELENIDYRKNDLINFFVKYNNCNNSEFINYEGKQEKDLFNITLRPGLNSSSLVIENTLSNSYDFDFSNQLGFRLGVEAEFIMPFNKNKWAVIIEPTYQYFNSEEQIILNPNTIFEKTESIEVNYASLELPIGIRYYFFLNNESKFFTNISYVVDFSSDSSKIKIDDLILDIESRPNWAIGFGYKQNDTYSLEFRIQTSREILGSFTYFQTDYNTFSAVFGYTLF